MTKDARITDSSKDSKYPRCSVFETPCGHQLQVDNTPGGGERIFWRHCAGTYCEITSEGNTINFCVGDSMTYNKSGCTTTTDECCDDKTFGHSKSQSGGGDNKEISGNTGIASGKTVAFVVMGDANIKCENAYVGVNKDMNVNVTGNMDVKVKGDFTETVGGDMTTTVGGTRHTKAKVAIKHN